MKKLLIILILFVSIINSAKAQTKEETITWLQEKLQKYLYYNSYGGKGEDIRAKVTECFITITFTIATTENQKPKKYYNQYFIIPTSGAAFSYSIDMKDGIKSIRSKDYDLAEYFSKSAGGMTITEGEEKLHVRIQKAIDHLATFCPKTKETF